MNNYPPWFILDMAVGLRQPHCMVWLLLVFGEKTCQVRWDEHTDRQTHTPTHMCAHAHTL